ncbi:type II toxin-antitoxin system RelE/ParE family toxin [Sphingobium sp. Z007]|uniref:type II toxin-antitoxin system RelE/ParE family toxin n=1 Tax=Sphingobium sp. Z007 TaxID=627495 RepID=UPI000B4A3D08|nr:type II toxin-antitoxin system RelE/ParE family toxin [Sphingobium sp. Z007]
MIVRWTPEARQDRSDIWDYLVALDPAAAMRMDAQFSVAVARLADYPMLGHDGAVPGTRELTPHPSYPLVYEVDGDTVWILTLVHAMRLWPPLR